jgi:glc operon protein GlcG
MGFALPTRVRHQQLLEASHARHRFGIVDDSWGRADRRPVPDGGACTGSAAGGTADGTPFDIPYGMPISLDVAKKLVAAAEAEALKHRWKMNIAVVDTQGGLVHFSRMDGAQLASIGISQGKARTAARFRRESRAFYNAFETGHAYVGTFDSTLGASPGGWPLIEAGKLIGAIGCSGGTGDQDAAACKAGADLVK